MKEKTGEHASIVYGTHFPNRLFIGCLPAKATAHHIGQLFSAFGSVIEAKVVLDEQKRSKRFGFVSFAKKSEAEYVLQQGTIYLMGKKINVGPAVKKQINDDVPKVPVRIVTACQLEDKQNRGSNCGNKPKYKFILSKDDDEESGYSSGSLLSFDESPTNNRRSHQRTTARNLQQQQQSYPTSPAIASQIQRQYFETSYPYEQQNNIGQTVGYCLQYIPEYEQYFWVPVMQYFQ